MHTKHLRSWGAREDGQSLVIVVLSMALIVAVAAFAIDVANWYATRHKAQVAADAAALAAANCLAKQACLSTSSTGDAASWATYYATKNGDSLSASDIAITTSTVTVTVRTTAASSFANLFGIYSTKISATAVAYYGDQCPSQASGGLNCISLFAGNDTCPTTAPGSKNNPPSPAIGLDLVTQDSGGGQETITDAFSNGYFYNAANSGSAKFTVTGTPCSTDYPSNPKSNTTFTSMPTAIPYPEVWNQPTCTYTASYWTTNASAPSGHVISSPGVYCITAGVSPASCSDDADAGGTWTSGAIYVGALTGTGYEFVGPCISLSGSAAVQNITGQPLVYGTSNITTAATSSALPTCTVNDGSNGASTYIDGNNAVVGGTIYDQCGTAVVGGNGASIAFIEAWNIDVLKNNVTGDGPTTSNGAIIESDQLIG